MRKSLIIFLFFNALIYSQTKFSQGFKDGYEKGYCQDSGMSCIPPISPISPLPQVGESLDSYQDGYNRGFKMGMSAQSDKENNKSRRTFETAPTQFVEDFIYNPYKDADLMKLKMQNNKLKAEIYAKEQQYKNLLYSDYEEITEDKFNNLLNAYDDAIKGNYLQELPYFMKGYILYKKGDILNSYNYISKAQSISPNEHTIKYGNILHNEVNNILKNLMSKSDFTNVKYFTENFWYENDLSNYYLGLSNYYLGDLKAAKKAFKKVANFEPAKDFLLAIENKQNIPNPFLGATSETTSTSNTQQNNSNDFLEKIQQYYKSKDYDKVLSLLEPLEKSIDIGKIQDKNTIWWVYSMKAGSNFKLKNWSEVVRDASNAINNSENNEIAWLYFMRAMSKTELKDYYGANFDFDFLIDNYSKLNYKENSIATLLNNKAYNLVLLKDYNSAKPIIDRAVGLDGNKGYIWDTKGELEYYLGNYDESVKAMTKSINITPLGNSFLYRGLSYLKLKNKNEGCRDLSKAGEMGESKAYEFIKSFCN